MKGMKYHGFFFGNEIYADNRKFYADCLKDPRYAATSGVSEEKARRTLEFEERFPPGQPHSRLVGHNARVHKIEDPQWYKTRGYAVPQGSPGAVVYSVDFVEEIRKTCTEEPILILSGNERALLQIPHFEMVFRPSDNEDFSYSFGIGRKTPRASEPMLYTVETYVTVDNVLVMQETETGRPRFKLKGNGDVCEALHSIAYSGKNPVFLPLLEETG